MSESFVYSDHGSSVGDLSWSSSGTVSEEELPPRRAAATAAAPTRPAKPAAVATHIPHAIGTVNPEKRIERLRRVRVAQRSIDDRVRRRVQARAHEAALKEVAAEKAKWEAGRQAEAAKLQSLHERALVMIGHGHRGAALTLHQQAKEAQDQLGAWATAVDTAFERSQRASEEAKLEADARAMRNPAHLMATARSLYNAWGAAPKTSQLERGYAKMARSRRHSGAKAKGVRVLRPIPDVEATVEDPTQATFSAIKAAEVEEASQRSRAEAAARRLTEETMRAKKRGARARTAAKRSTDARSIMHELERLQAADRRIRGYRSAAMWEAPPDSRAGALQIRKSETKLERAFERMLMA